MDALRIQNESSVAAGNMHVTANGRSITHQKAKPPVQRRVTQVSRGGFNQATTEPVSMDVEGNVSSRIPHAKKSSKKTVKKDAEVLLDDGSIVVDKSED